MAIEKVNTWNERLMSIGVSAFDYNLEDKVSGKPSQIAFQDLLTAIAIRRANAVEDELTPLSNIIRSRNKRLDRYGHLLSTLTRLDAEFTNDDGPDKSSKTSLSDEDVATLEEIGYEPEQNPPKAKVQEYLQAVKSAIDSVNNRAQSDTTRLQSLVDNRDHTYTKAAEVLKDVLETGSKSTGALGG